MRRMSSREMRRMMKKLGMQLNEIRDVEEVNIIKNDEILKITEPTVSMIKIGDQTIFQIVGEPIRIEREEKGTEEEKIEIPEEDVQLVAAQTGASLEEARKTLTETQGDLAKAILILNTMKR